MNQILSRDFIQKTALAVLFVAGLFALFINLPRLAQANGVQQVILISDWEGHPNEQARPSLFVASPQHDSVVTSNSVNYSARFSWINCGNVETDASLRVYEKISGGKITNANNAGDWRLLDQRSLNRGITCAGCDERANTVLELNGTYQLSSLVAGGSTTLWTVAETRVWKPATLYDFTYVNRAAAPAAAQCANGVDDDGDGKIDAADSSCHTDFNPNNAASYDPTITNEGRGGSGTCNDSKDNNGNGLIDGADPLCHTDGNANNPASFDGNRNESAPANNVSTVTDQQITVVVAGNNNNDKKDNNVEFSMSDDRETVKQGEVLTYKLRVRNNRDNDITNVKIVDRLPSYLIPLATQPGATANASNRTITWNNQTISANSEVTYSLRVRVGNDAPNGYLLQNSGIVNGDGIRASATDATLVQGVVPQVAGASISPITAVPVSAKTGLPIDTFSMLLSLSGSAATAGTLLVKRFI